MTKTEPEPLLAAAIEDRARKLGGVPALARALKVSPGYLYRLKLGYLRNPSDDLLKKLGLRKVIRIEAIEAPPGRSRAGGANLVR